MSKELARALRDTLISPNASDSNGEAPNLVDATHHIARAISIGMRQLGNGDADSHFGAIEAHGKAVLDAAEKIADALNNVAEAIRADKTTG